jgi:hypothetical protein
MLVSCSTALAAPSRRTTVFRPRFRLVGTNVGHVSTNGRFVLVERPPTGTLIDESSGRTSPLPTPPAGCNDLQTEPILTGQWLIFECFVQQPAPLAARLTSVDLYDVVSGHWKTVAPSGRVAAFIQQCSQEPTEEHGNCSYAAAAAGRVWIEWSEDQGYGVFDYYFQNLRTGTLKQLRGWKPGGRTVPQLDSEQLARGLCAPLRVPRGTPDEAGDTSSNPGSLSFSGSFALSLDYQYDGAHWVLERCGSSMHRVLTDWLASANQHTVLWTTSGTSHQIDGVFLPSLRPFKITSLPLGRFAPNQLLLSNRRIYATDSNSNLWVALAPQPDSSPRTR